MSYKIKRRVRGRTMGFGMKKSDGEVCERRWKFFFQGEGEGNWKFFFGQVTCEIPIGYPVGMSSRQLN